MGELLTPAPDTEAPAHSDAKHLLCRNLRGSLNEGLMPNIYHAGSHGYPDKQLERPGKRNNCFAGEP